jgi:hypothetical protein
MTSGAKADGRFGKQDFVYLAEDDVYRCPAGELLTYRYTAEEHGQQLRRYWTNACRTCALKSRCTTGVQRRVTRWEHEHVLEAVQRRLDANPNAMRTRRTTVEHPFGTIKADGRHALLDEEAAACCHRDGIARARLQFDTCTEYRRNKANDGRGHGVKRPDIISARATMPAAQATRLALPRRNRKNMLENARRAWCIATEAG